MAFFELSSVYPHIANIVNTDLPAVVADTTKFNALKRFGDFSDREARRALRRGSPKPQVVLKELSPFVWGFHDDNSDVLQLNGVLADQYEMLFQTRGTAQALNKADGEDEVLEDAARWQKLIEKARLCIEATILHEMVHWGDMRAKGDDGVADFTSKDPEAHRRLWKDVGHWFVDEAYGKKIGVSRIKARGGVTIKQSDLGIDGWLGWDANGYPFDPWEGGPASLPTPPDDP